MVQQAEWVFAIVFAAFAAGLGLMFVYGLVKLLVSTPHEEPKSETDKPRPQGKRKAIS
jgi:hypothetical protein